MKHIRKWQMILSKGDVNGKGSTPNSSVAALYDTRQFHVSSNRTFCGIPLPKDFLSATKYLGQMPVFQCYLNGTLPLCRFLP